MNTDEHGFFNAKTPRANWMWGQSGDESHALQTPARGAEHGSTGQVKNGAERRPCNADDFAAKERKDRKDGKLLNREPGEIRERVVPESI